MTLAQDNSRSLDYIARNLLAGGESLMLSPRKEFVVESFS